MKTMSLDGLKSYLDEHQIECKSPHSIFSSNSKIYNQMYEEMSDIDNFSPIPSVYDFNSYDEYQIQLDEWKKQMQYFIKETCLPVPLIHAIPRPMRPSTDKSRPKFNEPPRLTPRNFAVIVDIISNNKVIDLNMILPEKKLKDDLTLGVFMNDYYPWSSTLIPQRPSPSLYDSFIEYEVAMINWGDIVMKSELRETEIELKMKNEENEEKYKTEFNYDSDLPPGPAFIGQKAKLVAVSSSSNVPPPPPSEIINDQIPFVDLDFHENKFRDKLKKLKKCYQKFSSSPFILFSSIPNETSIMPPNTHYKNTFSVISILCMYGTPLSIQNNSLTNIFREEKTLFDIGSMTKGEHIIKGPNDKEYTYDEFFLILENDPIKLLLIDLSPIQFKELIQIPVPGNFPPKTVGVKIVERTSLQTIIDLSYFSESERFIAKFSVFMQHVIQFPDVHISILQLDLFSFERIVELIIFMSKKSVSIENLPDDEINEAIKDDPRRKDQIESFAMEFRQAQLINALCYVIFSGSHNFTYFLPFIRKLMHKSYGKITDIVTNDTLFSKIMEGYNSSNNHRSHNFFYRLIRTAIILQYSKTIRVLSGHDLLAFFKNGLNAKEKRVKRNTLSLWQLIIHSNTSIALQLQIIQSSPTSVVSLIYSASNVFHDVLMSSFQLFRQTKSMFSFQPLPFSQFEGFFSLFCSNFDEKRNSQFLYTLLTLCVAEEAIFCFKPIDFKNYINKFASTTALQLISHPSIMNFKCLKILYKINFLAHQSVNNSVIWSFILQEMVRKHDKVPLEFKLTAWKAFRNAALYQSHFIQFILNNEALLLKLNEAFSSIDEKVIACMIRTIPFLAKPLVRLFGVSEITKKNLTDLFSHLSDPSVNIAGKILTVYTTKHQTVEMRKVNASLNQFLVMLFNADHGSVLYKFMNAPHVQNELSEVFLKFEKSHHGSFNM